MEWGTNEGLSRTLLLIARVALTCLWWVGRHYRGLVKEVIYGCSIIAVKRGRGNLMYLYNIYLTVI